MAKPRVLTKCVANSYAASNERIVEIAAENGSGLLALRNTPDGRLRVSLYRLDSTVDVGVSYDDTSGAYSIQEDNPHSMLPWSIYDSAGKIVANVRSEEEARRFALFARPPQNEVTL